MRRRVRKNQDLTPIGMIGLGLMGSAMSASLIRAGYRVVGFDVLASRRREHVRAKGVIAASARDLGAHAPIVITSLPSSEALVQTADDLARSSPSPRIVIETSTLPIAVKERARKHLQTHGITLLDCPLSGTAAQAREKDVVVYVSGPRAAYRRVAPIMDAFARSHHYVGAFGAGSKMKFIANLLVAIHNVAAAEALVLAMKSGLDPALVVNVIGDGAGGSRMFQVRGPMMVKGNYSKAMMKLDVWQKDMTIIADFARRAGCRTPLFSATAPLYEAAIAMGRQSQDTAAVCAVLERMARYRRS